MRINPIIAFLPEHPVQGFLTAWPERIPACRKKIGNYARKKIYSYNSAGRD